MTTRSGAPDRDLASIPGSAWSAPAPIDIRTESFEGETVNIQASRGLAARGATTVALAVATALSPLPAWTAEPSAGPELGEIVVTARKREESLQEVPLAITALDTTTIERAGIRDLAGVAANTPGLVFVAIGGNGDGALPIIRGLTQTQVTARQSNVAVYLDGVYLSNRQALNLQLVDVERIEVIKGPQSTLYGQSAYAGAINYVMARPTPALAGYVEAQTGSDGYLSGRAAIGGPLGETVGFRLAASWSQFDGTIENVATGDNAGSLESNSVSGILEFTPNDVLKMSASLYRSSQDNGSGPNYILYQNNCGVSAAGPTRWCGEVPTRDRVDISPYAYGGQAESTLAMLDVAVKLGGAWSIRSNTSYLKARMDSLTDGDYTSAGYPSAVRNTVTGATRTIGANYAPGFNDNEDKNFSQELRLEYETERLRGSVGGFWFDSDNVYNYGLGVDTSGLGPNEVFTNPTTALLAGRFGTTNNTAKTSTLTEATRKYKAVFADASFSVTDRLRLTAEVRRTKDTEEVARLFNFGLVSNPPDRSSGEWTYTTPRFSADFKLSDTAMLYASAAKGVRSGGAAFFASPRIPEEGRYLPETNRTYEVGLRTTSADRRYLFNATVFYSDLKNLQVSQPSRDPQFPFRVTGNLGAAEAKGFELEFSASPGQTAQFGLGYAYTDPKFKSGQYDYAYAGCGTDTSICGVQGPQGGPDIGGHQLPYSHKHQINGNLTLQRTLASGTGLYARADAVYLSSTVFDTVGILRFGGYTIANLRIGAEFGPFDVSLWGRNLTDEATVTAAYNDGRLDGRNLTEVHLGERRTYGLTARYRFGP
jgi:iron complex outermembrane receptor protein